RHAWRARDHHPSGKARRRAPARSRPGFIGRGAVSPVAQAARSRCGGTTRGCRPNPRSAPVSRPKQSDSNRGVLDTSTVILMQRLGDPSALPPEPVITAVTLAELSVGPLVARTEQERAA